MSVKTVFLQMLYEGWQQLVPLLNAMVHVLVGFLLGRWR